MKINAKLLVLPIICPTIWVTDAFAGYGSILSKLTRTNGNAVGVLYSATVPGQSVNGHGYSPSFYSAPSAPEADQAWKISENTLPQRAEKVLKSNEDVWEAAKPVIIQGGSLRTCSFDDSVKRVQVLLKTEGRPLNSKVELWQGPDNSPEHINVYIEDGSLREFRAVIETPRCSNAVCIRNTANMEFPLTACVDLAVEDGDDNIGSDPVARLSEMAKAKIVQGGAVNTTPFPASVSRVQVMLKTDGRPLNARIELLQGPNNNKQVMELYIEDGADRPFYAIIDTPGSGNVVRIKNTSTVEFPMSASVTAYEENSSNAPDPYESGPGMVWSD